MIGPPAGVKKNENRQSAERLANTKTSRRVDLNCMKATAKARQTTLPEYSTKVVTVLPTQT